MRAKSTKTYPTTKQENEFVAALEDVVLRAAPNERAELVDILLKGAPAGELDPFRVSLLRSAGALGLRLPQQHLATYEVMSAKSAEHSRKVSDGIRNRLAAKAQAERAQRNDPAHDKSAEPTAGTSAAPEKSVMEKLADLAPPDLRYPTGLRGTMAPRPASTPLPSGSSTFEAPYPLRPLSPKPNS